MCMPVVTNCVQIACVQTRDVCTVPFWPSDDSLRGRTWGDRTSGPLTVGCIPVPVLIDTCMWCWTVSTAKVAVCLFGPLLHSMPSCLSYTVTACVHRGLPSPTRPCHMLALYIRGGVPCLLWMYQRSQAQ